MSDLIGKSLGRYQILEQIGEGGMASVYKANDRNLDRFVAIKFIHLQGIGSDTSLVRFKQEAFALGKLSHPYILSIFDIGEFEGRPYLVMEYIPGGTLKELLKGKPIPWERAVQITISLARALETAHSKGIIHRDVKPSNILMANGSDPKLSDFGIAKLIESEEGYSGVTGTGIGIGTPDYMAPEQAAGNADARADIYALGTVFYQMVTGSLPFRADTPMAVMIKKSTEPPPSLKKFVRDIPSAVEIILLKALARDPNNRYKNMREFANALESLRRSADVLQTVDDMTVAVKSKPVILAFTYGIIALLCFGILIVGAFFGARSLVNLPALRDALRSPYIWGIAIILLTLIGISRYKSQLQIFINKNTGIFKSQREVHKPNGEGNFSSTMTMNIIASLDPKRQRKIVTLINREHELRIKDILVHYGGGKYLLHGFGRFGASALIDQIVEQVRFDIKNLHLEYKHGIIMMVRVELTDLDDNDKVFRAIVRDFRFEAQREKYAKSIAKRLHRLQNNNFTRVRESGIENTISIKATPIPGLETSFSRKSDRTINPVGDTTTESGIIDVISQFLDEAEVKKPNSFEKIVEKVASSSKIPSRVIIVLDKIYSDKVFRVLQNMRLFSDDRITFFAIVREEEFVKWDPSVYQMINDIGFREYYVPCVWEEEHHLAQEMVKLSLSDDDTLDETTTDFINHVAYKSRGAPGDMVKELVDPIYNVYETGVPQLRLDSLRDKKVVRFNSMLQTFLASHWDKILGDDFLGLKDTDRAKMGVYELMDWMTQQVEFNLSDLEQSLLLGKVSISPSAALRRDVIKRLMGCMIADGLLSTNQDLYRVVANKKILDNAQVQ